MAEVTEFRNNALNYPVAAQPWAVVFPILDNTGAPVSSAAGLDSERSLNGDTFADCTNEATEIGSSGMYYLLLTPTEMFTQILTIIVKTSTTDAKTTPIVLYPSTLVNIEQGTAQAGSASTITLASTASAVDGFYNGTLIAVQVDSVHTTRRIIAYVGSTKVATVHADFVTNPDSSDTYEIFLPEEMLSPDVSADALLARNVSGGSSTGRIVKQALYALRNKWMNAAGTYTVFETDDSTTSWTATNTSDAAAEPITGSDPS